LIEHHLQRLIERLTQPGLAWPQQVDTQARWLVLDTLGCAIAGARAPTVRAWLEGQHLRADPFATASPAPGGLSPGAAMAFAMAARVMPAHTADLAWPLWRPFGLGCIN
jgi:2-methylcitrate dehydratase PrpD